MYQIEEEILNYLMGTEMFRGKDPSFVRIFGLFLTRRCLTQTTIQEITGLSAGKISQEVNHLIDMNLIERPENPDPHKKVVYRAGPAGVYFLNFTKSIIEHISHWEKQFGKANEDLEKNSELENLEGFEKIYHLVRMINSMIKNYKQFLVQIESKIEELSKE